MNNKGRFIVIEGLEGAGKTTAISTLKALLVKKGIHPVLTREPGGTKIGEILRNLVKTSQNQEPIADLTELLLVYASRVQLIKTVIEPALARGDWVIADRFEASTYAYQGGGRGIDTSIIQSLSKICLNGFHPDLLLYLDISPKSGLERAQARGEIDRIESESIDFFQRVQYSYYNLLKDCEYCQFIDAADPLESVQTAIHAVMDAFFRRINHESARKTS